jgi:acyl dehydratase
MRPDKQYPAVLAGTSNFSKFFSMNDIVRSLYFDDFAVGQKFVTKARTITEADIVNFAGLSWDHNQLHTDAEFAASTRFGRRIVHGLLGLVVHAGLSYQLTEQSILALLELTWQFKAPIYIGDTIHVEQRVREMKPGAGGDRGVLTFEKKVVNQKNEVVQTGTTTILLARRPKDGRLEDQEVEKIRSG